MLECAVMRTHVKTTLAGLAAVSLLSIGQAAPVAAAPAPTSTEQLSALMLTKAEIAAAMGSDEVFGATPKCSDIDLALVCNLAALGIGDSGDTPGSLALVVYADPAKAKADFVQTRTDKRRGIVKRTANSFVLMSKVDGGWGATATSLTGGTYFTVSGCGRKGTYKALKPVLVDCAMNLLNAQLRKAGQPTV